jgi:hypothetical protein
MKSTASSVASNLMPTSRVVRVFTSLTFRDFGAERDLLVKRGDRAPLPASSLGRFSSGRTLARRDGH